MKKDKDGKELDDFLEFAQHVMKGLCKELDKDDEADEPEKPCEHDDECEACAAKGKCGREHRPDGACDGDVERIVAKRGSAAIEALRVINGERQDVYGNPEDTFTAIASLWNSYAGTNFSRADVAVLMALLKIGRMSGGIGLSHRDNVVDAIGYLALAADMAAEQETGQDAASGRCVSAE